MRNHPSLRCISIIAMLLVSATFAGCGGDDGGGGKRNVAPTAAFTVSPASGAGPLNVTMDASGATDPDGAIRSYAWDFGDQTAHGVGVRVDHVYAAAGTYTVTLTVTDDRGATASTTHGVTVTANQAPTAAFDATPEKGIVPVAVALDAGSSSDSDGSISGYAWDFADGSTGTGILVTHTYAEPGRYSVKLTVTDDNGATATVTRDLIAMSPLAAAGYTVVEIPSLGGSYIEPRAINNLGHVTGFSDFDASGASRAFSYSDGRTTDLGTLGGRESYANAINASGDIVGTSETAAGYEHAFVYRGGAMQDLGTLGGFSSSGSGIDDWGRVVGTSEDQDGFNRAFVYDQGRMTAFSIDSEYSAAEAISSEYYMVAGQYRATATEIHAYVLGYLFLDLGTLGGDQAYVRAINSSGDVVGMSTPSAGGFTGFLYRDHAMKPLVTGYSEPNDINDAGVVVGYAHFGADGHAFVWDPAGGMRDLNQLIDPSLGWTLQVAAGINDLGQIVGHGYRSGGAHVAVLLTPVY
jgi:probable HAF family extracellular repeat protein